MKDRAGYDRSANDPDNPFSVHGKNAYSEVPISGACKGVGSVCQYRWLFVWGEPTPLVRKKATNAVDIAVLPNFKEKNREFAGASAGHGLEVHDTLTGARGALAGWPGQPVPVVPGVLDRAITRVRDPANLEQSARLDRHLSVALAM